MDIDSMTVAEVVIAPDFVHQYLTSEDAAWRLGQQSQQIKLGWCELHFTAIDLDTTSGYVDGQAGKLSTLSSGEDDGTGLAGGLSALAVLRKMARTRPTSSRGLNGLTR